MTKRVKVVSAALVLVMTGVMGTGTAWAELNLSPTSNFPHETTLGDSSLRFLITVINTSNEIGNANDPAIPVNLTELDMTPSCESFGGTACATPELDVFDIETGPAAASGIDGACLGTTFTVSERDGTGRHTITPDAPVVLGPSDDSGGTTLCTLEMTIEEVLRLPATDVQPAQDGIQTRRSVNAQIVDPLSGRSAGQLETALVTVFPSQATIFTESDPSVFATGPVPPGSAATDMATVVRINPETDADPTGTVTFTLMGPDPDAQCTGPVAFGPETVAIDPATGQARSSSTGPLNDPGLYNWVATFESGDNNYESIPDPVGCNEDQARFVVQQLPVIEIDKTPDPTSQPGVSPAVYPVKTADPTSQPGVSPAVGTVKTADPTSQPERSGFCPAEPSGYERVEKNHPADVNRNGFVCVRQIKGKGNSTNVEDIYRLGNDTVGFVRPPGSCTGRFHATVYRQAITPTKGSAAEAAAQFILAWQSQQVSAEMGR